MPFTRDLPFSSFTPSSVSAIALGWPGRLRMSAAWSGVSRSTPTWRERIAVGTKCPEMARICSPKPGISRVATASVASGVTSRRAGPVPPVVSTRSHPMMSTSSRSVRSMSKRSSAMRRRCTLTGVRITLRHQASSAGMPLSS